MSRAAIIGGGFYGASIALYLKRKRQVSQVILLERSERLLTRGSYTNQARIHGGYHYPRSFTTAHRSVQNAPRFATDFGPAVVGDFTKLYALARRNSKVTTQQMVRFCREIGAPLGPAPRALEALFNPALIASVFLAREQAFDADVLRAIMAQRLAQAGVEVRTGHEATALVQTGDAVRIGTVSAGRPSELVADIAFNCTYSRLGPFWAKVKRARPWGSSMKSAKWSWSNRLPSWRDWA